MVDLVSKCAEEGRGPVVRIELALGVNQVYGRRGDQEQTSLSPSWVLSLWPRVGVMEAWVVPKSSSSF